MSDKSYMKYLSMYFGETGIEALLKDFEIFGSPKLPKGDVDAYLSNHNAGIELTFTDEHALDVKGIRDYPEGTLVLSNIRFYGVADDDIRPFIGELPLGLKFGMTPKSVMDLLGQPHKSNPRNTKMRWDFDGFCLFSDFTEEGALKVLSVQLPLA